MANMIREIFSISGPEYKIKISFQSPEDFNRFLEKFQYEHDMIAKRKNEIMVPIETRNGNKTIKFLYYHFSQQNVAETEKGKFFYIKFERSDSKPPDLNITYEFHYECVHSASEAFGKMDEAVGIISLFHHNIYPFLDDKGLTWVEITVGAFSKRLILLEKLSAIERELSMTFDVSKATGSSWDEEIIDSIYYLLVKKYAVRKPAQLLYPGDRIQRKVFIQGDVEVGKTVDCTYISEKNYSLFGEKIHIFTTSLLSNAIIRDKTVDQEGLVKVLLGEADSNPMSTSYKGHKTEEEAMMALQSVMEEAYDYKNALSIRGYAIRDEADET